MNKDYHELPGLLPEEVIERANKLNPALLCNGMKGRGVPMGGCMEANMMPVNRDPTLTMMGTALTVETDCGDNFPIHVATYSAKKGYVNLGEKMHRKGVQLAGIMENAFTFVGRDNLMSKAIEGLKTQLTICIA